MRDSIRSFFYAEIKFVDIKARLPLVPLNETTLFGNPRSFQCNFSHATPRPIMEKSSSPRWHSSYPARLFLRYSKKRDHESIELNDSFLWNVLFKRKFVASLVEIIMTCRIIKRKHEHFEWLNKAIWHENIFQLPEFSLKFNLWIHSVNSLFNFYVFAKIIKLHEILTNIIIIFSECWWCLITPAPADNSKNNGVSPAPDQHRESF